MAKLKVEKTTDLIAFADSISDEDVIKMLQYRKVMTGREDVEILDPSDENFVLWAKNPENVKTNINFGTTIYPKGLTYTQYPGTDSPLQLGMQVPQDCSWVNITSDYAGLFFRAEGGSSAEFSNIDIIKQDHALQGHRHSVSSSGSHSHPLYSVIGTTYKYIGISGTATSQGNSVSSGAHTHNTGIAIPYPTGTSPNYTYPYGATVNNETETRPVNTAIRIWKVCDEEEVNRRLLLS